MPTCKFTKKKLFHLSSFMYFAFPFSQNVSRLLLPKRPWKCVSTISFKKYKRKVVLLAIYLFIYDSSRSTFFMLNRTFEFSWVQFLSNKLEFFVSCNINITTRSRWRLKCLCAEPRSVSEPRISQGHVIKGSYDIIGRSPSREAIVLPSLVAIDTLVIETWWFLFAWWPCKTT